MDVIGRRYVLITSGSSGVDTDNKNCILNYFNPTTKKNDAKAKEKKYLAQIGTHLVKWRSMSRRKKFSTQKKKFTKIKVSAWTTLSHLHF